MPLPQGHVTENRLLRNQITGRVRLTDGEPRILAEIGQQPGKQALADVATIVKPETILTWHRKLVVQKFDGSKHRQALGRPKVEEELAALVVSAGPTGSQCGPVSSPG